MKHALLDIRPRYENALSHDAKLSRVDLDLTDSLKALYIWVNAGENHSGEWRQRSM